MPTQSSFVQSSTAFTTTTTPKTLTLTWATGDVIVVGGIAADGGGTFASVPTATGLTFTQVATVGTAGVSSRVSMWTATAAAAGTAVTVSLARGGTTTIQWGFTAWVYSAVSAVGASASADGGTTNAQTLALTTTAANSSVVYASSDWAAISDAAATAAPSGAVFDLHSTSSGQYTWYFGHLLSAGAAGAQSYGVSVTGATKFSHVVLELKGSAVAAVRPGLPNRRFWRAAHRSANI